MTDFKEWAGNPLKIGYVLRQHRFSILFYSPPTLKSMWIWLKKICTLLNLTYCLIYHIYKQFNGNFFGKFWSKVGTAKDPPWLVKKIENTKSEAPLSELSCTANNNILNWMPWLRNGFDISVIFHTSRSLDISTKCLIQVLNFQFP